MSLFVVSKKEKERFIIVRIFIHNPFFNIQNKRMYRTGEMEAAIEIS